MKYIYVISTRNNLYKIGSASDVEKRIKFLQVGNPYKLSIVNKFKTCNEIYVENEIHAFLKNNRTFGEWFELNDNELEVAIEMIKILIRKYGMVEHLFDIGERDKLVIIDGVYHQYHPYNK